MKQPTIAIIGAGAVGSTAAYAAIVRDIPAKIMVVDINVKKCEGEIEDLTDTLSMSGTSEVYGGSLQDAGQADIIVITAGIPQKAGQTRLELLKTNYDVVGSIVKAMKPIKKSSIIIVVTNPIDILTRYVQEVADLPKNQIFGSGTFLDTHRLRGLLGEHLHINPSSIHAYVLGEHGDSQFVAWSTAQVGCVPLSSFPELNQQTLDVLAQKAQHKAYDIIACKGFTSFGIAACIATYCENIIGDLKRVIPVSCFIEKYGVCLSMPAVIGAQGIEKILQPPLNDLEQKKLEASAKILEKQWTETT